MRALLLIAAFAALPASAGWVRINWDASPGVTAIRSGCVAAGQYERAPVSIAGASPGNVTIEGLPDSGRCYFELNAGPQDEWVFDFATNVGARALPGPVRNLDVTWSPTPPLMTRIGGGFAEPAPGQRGTIAWPQGTAAGQAALLDCSWFELYSNAVLTVPAGFAAITPSVVLGGTGTQESRAQLFAAVLDGQRTGTLPIAFSGSVYGNCVLDVYQTPTPITSISAAVGTPASSTTSTAPAVTTPGYVVWAFALTDPATMTTPSGAQVGQAGGTATNTARHFFLPDRSAGATAARSSTLGTARGNVGMTVVLQ